jgi:tRNA-uridine 2-sulfurtransferase
MYYTLGQRRGLHIGGRRGAREAPWYVVGKDSATGTLQVSQDAQHPLLLRRALRTEAFHWIRQPAPLPPVLQARIRHRQALQECRAQPAGNGAVEVHFAQPQRAITAGQFCVLYDGDECLGGGEIACSLPEPTP